MYKKIQHSGVRKKKNLGNRINVKNLLKNIIVKYTLKGHTVNLTISTQNK